MSIARIRPLASFSAASALALSLLVATPAAGSEATVDEDSLGDESSLVEEVPDPLAGRTMLRFQVAMGDDDPVVGGRLVVTDPDGQVLAQGRTDINGQVVVLTKKTLGDRGVVRVTWGRTKVLQGRSIDLRAFFDPAAGDIVYVNPLSTLDETCRSGNLGTLCSQTVASFYELPPGVEHEKLVHSMRVFFNGTRFSRETQRRDLTTWQWAKRIVAKAYAGQTIRSDVDVHTQSKEAAIGTTAIGGLVTMAAGKALMKWTAGKVAGGALNVVGGELMNRLLIAAGWADEGVTRKDIEDIRRDLSELKQAINQVIEGQALIRSDIASLDNQIRSGRYYSEVQAFNSGKGQSSALDFLSEELSFMLTFIDCANTTPDAQRCNGRQPVSMPDDGGALGVCAPANLQEISSRWGRAAVAQCAWLGQYLRNYVTDFSFGRAADFVRGESSAAAGSVGLIPLGQEQYSRTVLNGAFNGAGQARMMGVGGYWLNKWAIDITAWTLAAQQPAILRQVMAPETAADRAWQASTQWERAEQDTTGRYFPERISEGCGNAIFFDVATGSAYTRGVAHFFGRARADQLVVNTPHLAVPGAMNVSNLKTERFAPGCNQVRPVNESATFVAPAYAIEFLKMVPGWRPVSAGRADNLGRVLDHLRATHASFRIANGGHPMRIGIGDWRALGDRQSYLGCYQVRFADHHHRAGGGMVACPYIDYSNPSKTGLAKVSDTHFAVACSSIELGAYIDYVPSRNNWARALDSRPGSDRVSPSGTCAASDQNWFGSHTLNAYLFPGPYGQHWVSTPFFGEEHRGPWKLARKWGVRDSAGNGHAYNFLPHYYDRVPEEMRNTGQVTQAAPYQLLMRPMVGVPRV